MDEAASPVDRLKAVIGAETDIALASELGVERSTVAQWRRRGTIPKLYRGIVDTQAAQDILSGVHAARRQIYGDGGGVWFVRAALAVLPTHELDYPALSPFHLGYHRERLIAYLVPVISKVCRSQLGIPRITTEPEYARLLEALETPEAKERVAQALLRPTL